MRRAKTERDASVQEHAHWISLLLTAQTGEVVTSAQLLGTDAEEKADREAAAKKDVAKLIRKMRRAEKKRLTRG